MKLFPNFTRHHLITHTNFFQSYVTRRQNVHIYRSRDSTSCHVIARNISRFHSVFLWTGYRYSFKSKYSNVKSKKCSFCKYFILSPNDAFIHCKCLPIAYLGDGKIVQSCRVTRSENSAKFHVLFKDGIVVGEIPIFWLICLTETSFSSSKSAMYARYSSLKARVKTMHGK